MLTEKVLPTLSQTPLLAFTKDFTVNFKTPTGDKLSNLPHRTWLTRLPDMTLLTKVSLIKSLSLLTLLTSCP